MTGKPGHFKNNFFQICVLLLFMHATTGKGTEEGPPVLSLLSTEAITTTQIDSQNLEGNNLEPTLHSNSIEQDYRYSIQPTKTQPAQNEEIQVTTMGRSSRSYRERDHIDKRQPISNQIELLEGLAKVSVDHPPTQSFRESRDENRKANPDIQDIITGIVKILHGKANGQSHHEAVRPRPQPSRINNRGPPRISDLPPLDFDTPPSYIPPPSQSNRIPPPYPFDVPPSPPPSIPLQLKPMKPTSRPPEYHMKESLPDALPTEMEVPSHTSPVTFVKNEDNKADKNKGPHKVVSNTNGNKVGNKRVRPRPPSRTRPQNTATKTNPTIMKPVFEIIQDTTTEPITELPLFNETTVPKNISKPAIEPTTTKFTTKTATQVINSDPVGLPTLLSPVTGVGEATPILESSIIMPSGSTKQGATKTPVLPEFEARPGIVLDDTEYKPGGYKRPSQTQRPIITAPPAGLYGQVFDVTVHAIQGGKTSDKPVIVPVDLSGSHGESQQDVSVITRPQQGQDFVSIDGKRTYINLFGETVTPEIAPTSSLIQPSGTSYPTTPAKPEVASSGPPPRRPYQKPTQPPVRIDTCIVGDDSTCDAAQNERCQTEDRVSSCHCKPGYNRRKHRDPCRRVISMSTSLRIDRLYDRKVVWRDAFKDPESAEYRELSYEASKAIASAMSMTPFSDDFINSQIISMYVGKNEETKQPAVFINMTIQLEENLDTVRPAVRHDIQKHLIRVIHRRNNNVGNSAVWVDSPPGSISALEDIDECSSQELHDCHFKADCTNTFGSFKCACQPGLRDPWIGNVHREGRHCESCGAEFCNNRGECFFEHGQQVCRCTGSFYGTQCEVDGEVLGVAIGASVAAAIIIILTLVCLCMWSRRWSREQKCAVGVGMGSPVFGFMANGPTVKTPNIGAPPYQISLEERIRWAQMADVMAHANHYAQPEPGVDGSRATYSTHGGYPTLGNHTLNSMGSLPLPAIAPPVPLPRLALASKAHSIYGAHSQHGSIHHALKTSLDMTSSSEEEDRADLLGRQLSAPRPKSRASLTNQSGIYYDVDLERAEMYGKQNIPLNTYTVNSQHQLRPFFR